MIARIAAALLAAASMAGAFAQTDLTEGEVRKVDRASGKITLRHGEIKNLDMPPMTMVFGVRDTALLANIAAGDKVKFAADKDGSQYIITTIRK